MGARKSFIITAILLVFSVYLMASYNILVSYSQQVEASWTQVQNVYQRRLDLISNLVSTVKGYAAHEKNTLTAVTQARTLATSVQGQLAANLPNDQNIKQLEQTQAALGNALSRLLVVVERYPDLKANQNFLALQAELAGTENRIAIERKRYNDIVKKYNIRVQRFPGILYARLFGFKPIPYFQAAPETQKVPQIKFD